MPKGVYDHIKLRGKSDVWNKERLDYLKQLNGYTALEKAKAMNTHLPAEKPFTKSAILGVIYRLKHAKKAKQNATD